MKRKFVIFIAGLFVSVLLVASSVNRSSETETGTIPCGVRPFKYTSGYLLGPPIVAVVKCNSYDLNEVRRAMDEAIGLIGGLGDIIKPGDIVGIKPNLCDNTPSEWGVTTHVNIVLALIEQIRKITNNEIIIMEGTGASPTSDCFRDLGWKEIERNGCALLDLNHPFPHTEFGTYTIPGGGLHFKELRLNKEIEKVDIFISVAKLKMHSSAGITLTLKNQFGVPPRDIYAPEGTSKMMLHGQDPRYDLPKVINDINACNPIDLGIVDGVIGLEGGEGYWIPTASRRASHLLIVGKNAVAVDAVGTFLMGYDPTAEYPNPPFINTQSHLRIARDLGLGPTDLNKIDIRLGKGIKNLKDMVVKYGLPWQNPDIPADFKPDEVKRIVIQNREEKK